MGPLPIPSRWSPVRQRYCRVLWSPLVVIVLAPVRGGLFFVENPLNISDYTNFARTTAVYPEALEGGKLEIMYLALGLAGEAGEVANKTKKLYRDGDTRARRSGIVDELGDVFWYLVRICDALHVDPEDLMGANADKLAVRKALGSLHGDGDSR